MKPSKIMLFSAFITAILLVVVGVVTTSLLLNQKANETQVKYDQIVEQAIQREVQYQQLVADANQKIETANNNLLAMQSQLEQLQPAQPAMQKTSALANLSAAITADAAGQIAQQVADKGQTLLKQPELVDFQGKASFEALFDKRSIFVDAQDGTILFNGTIPQQITAEEASQIVVDYMNYKNVLQVDLIHLSNQPLYRVILQNGYIAYVDMDGQITHINPPSTSNASLSVDTGSSGGGGSSSSSHSSSSHSEHESGGD